jgi:hypothetical protein
MIEWLVGQNIVFSNHLKEDISVLMRFMNELQTNEIDWQSRKRLSQTYLLQTLYDFMVMTNSDKTLYF